MITEIAENTPPEEFSEEPTNSELQVLEKSNKDKLNILRKEIATLKLEQFSAESELKTLQFENSKDKDYIQSQKQKIEEIQNKTMAAIEEGGKAELEHYAKMERMDLEIRQLGDINKELINEIENAEDLAKKEKIMGINFINKISKEQEEIKEGIIGVQLQFLEGMETVAQLDSETLHAIKEQSEDFHDDILAELRDKFNTMVIEFGYDPANYNMEDYMPLPKLHK